MTDAERAFNRSGGDAEEAVFILVHEFGYDELEARELITAHQGGTDVEGVELPESGTIIEDE